MQRKHDKKPYKIVAAYDTETTNICDFSQIAAFPVLHQLGIFLGDSCEDITPDNVRELVHIDLFRHAKDAFLAFDDLIELGTLSEVVPVCMVHNLSFDMHSLAPYLKLKNVKVLAKSATRPISFTILDEEEKPALVFWDTLGFFSKSLAVLGDEVGFPKLAGAWDYDLIRTPETLLTNEEIAYAKHDIYVLFAAIGDYLRKNPLILENKLGLNVVTKTGAVREKRKRLFDHVRNSEQKYNVGRFWNFQNRKELPKTDDELFTMHACTRGGFTFCASRAAGVPFDFTNSNKIIAGFDAASQHPAQMVSHFYPEGFEPASVEQLKMDADIIRLVTPEFLVAHWDKPFYVAFNAQFKFKNLRLKKDSVFERDGIEPLAFARVKPFNLEMNEENQQSHEFLEMISALGYRDYAIEPVHNFGKLVAAKEVCLWLTELAFWEVCQCYDFDSFEPISGYDTMKFSRPSDLSILSVMYFFNAKNTFKEYKEKFDSRESLGDCESLEAIAPRSLVERMATFEASDAEVKAAYQIYKSDLNALFGIECTNEAREDMILTDSGIETVGLSGVCNLPDNPKTWYQFGQRIVGWSRIAQNIVLQLAGSYCDLVINGDTDSVKIITDNNRLSLFEKNLEHFANSITKAKKFVCLRVMKNYPEYYSELSGVGAYECEFITKKFAASWNKAYCTQTFDKKAGRDVFSFTIAGLATDASGFNFDNSFNALANALYEQGKSFEEVCNILLGYNLTIDASITKFNGRKIPEWGASYKNKVIDYLGNAANVDEPAALALFPMAKTIGGFDNTENEINYEIASRNNPNLNAKQTLLVFEEGKEPEIIIFE